MDIQTDKRTNRRTKSADDATTTMQSLGEPASRSRHSGPIRARRPANTMPSARRRVCRRRRQISARLEIVARLGHTIVHTDNLFTWPSYCDHSLRAGHAHSNPKPHLFKCNDNATRTRQYERADLLSNSKLIRSSSSSSSSSSFSLSTAASCNRTCDYVLGSIGPMCARD